MEYFGHIKYGELTMYKDLADEILKYHDPVKARQKKYQKKINIDFYKIDQSKDYKIEFIYQDDNKLERYLNPSVKLSLKLLRNFRKNENNFVAGFS